MYIPEMHICFQVFNILTQAGDARSVGPGYWSAFSYLLEYNNQWTTNYMGCNKNVAFKKSLISTALWKMSKLN